MPGPVPLYNNPPIQPQYYEPSRFAIVNVTLGLTTLVETSVDHNYVVGQLVRLLIPEAYGSYQLNNQEAYVITVVSTTIVELDLDSRFYNPYIASPTLVAPNKSIAQIMAIGDINAGRTNATGRTNTGTYILGSFINISPN